MRQGLRTTPRPKTVLDPETIQALVEARHGDPFAVLGPHRAAGKEVVIRVLLPGAVTVEAIKESGKPLLTLTPIHPGGLFEGMFKGVKELPAYRLRVDWGSGIHELDDPYRFGPVLGPMDDYLLGEGTHRRLYDKLGAHLIEHEGASGVHFAVWAPDASRVAVVGDFNGWDGRRHGLRRRVDTGVWEIFIPGLGEGAAYKYEIKARDGSMLPLKADPLAFAAEFRPNTASIVRQTKGFVWNDAAWLKERSRAAARDAPVSIYEVHLGSWRRDAENRYLSYDELADTLLPYVKEMGFSHLELLPINEYPFDGSWGYQPIGLYAPTSRFGDPQAFVRFVDRAHALGLGIILDWVPGHFPTDPHGLARFDGTALYEHLDPRQGFHHDWNTFIYNFGRPEVANFLHANALFWLERYHVDGLRVDAVASMLYLDYSRPADEWVPNVHGGRENLETIAFLRRLNELTYGEAPGSVTIAEESTSWPGVSRPPYAGGLGFGYKWNMGWMNDTLDYMGRDPIHRRHHHHQLTFGLAYAWSENFVLPLSHDEVVHGKRSILGRMPGDPWQQFANLRAYYAFMWAHPGKKLLFMGQEFGQGAEWNYDRGLDWHLLDTPWHAGVQALVRQLNELYRTIPALHRKDCEPQGFAWVEADDYQRSIYSFLRLGNADDPPVLVVCNFTPQPRFDERFGVPRPGLWRERLNTDAEVYGGSNVGNQGEVTADEVAWHGRPYSLRLAVPPLGVVYLEWAGSSAEPA